MFGICPVWTPIKLYNHLTDDAGTHLSSVLTVMSKADNFYILVLFFTLNSSKLKHRLLGPVIGVEFNSINALKSTF